MLFQFSAFQKFPHFSLHFVSHFLNSSVCFFWPSTAILTSCYTVSMNIVGEQYGERKYVGGQGLGDPLLNCQKVAILVRKQPLPQCRLFSVYNGFLSPSDDTDNYLYFSYTQYTHSLNKINTKHNPHCSNNICYITNEIIADHRSHILLKARQNFTTAPSSDSERCTLKLNFESFQRSFFLSVYKKQYHCNYPVIVKGMQLFECRYSYVVYIYSYRYSS